jgi:ribosomal protein L11 methyltransferase
MKDKGNVKYTWPQLTLEAVGYHPKRLEDALVRSGALAVTLSDAGNCPILEPEPGQVLLWPHTRVTGLFDLQADMDSVEKDVMRFLDYSPIHSHLTELKERNWVQAWMDHFHPMLFGKRLWVCPRSQVLPEPTAVNIRLNPGLAFGTGTHPTTALCLIWLDNMIELTNLTVLDYGCGSGILAIAAAKLGASHIWAVDIDPQSLLASSENAVENNVEDRITLSIPDSLPIALSVDILLANILAGILVKLVSKFGNLVKSGGRLVISGILLHEVESVQTALSHYFQFKPSMLLEDWVLLEGIRR